MDGGSSEAGEGSEPLQIRAEALERTLLARLALDVIDETIDSKVSSVSFQGPSSGGPMEQRCPICLEFVEAGDERYVLQANGHREFPFHRHCLEGYMESQVTLYSGISGK